MATLAIPLAGSVSLDISAGGVVVAGFAVVVVMAVIAVAVSYNRFAAQRNLIRDSWSNVDTELQRRYDLVPNLVAAVRAYADHERRVLDEVAQARTSAMATTGSADRQARAEAGLTGALRQLLVVSEGYPELQSSANFVALQRELVNTEDRLQSARRFYNANVADYNRRLASVPSNLVGRATGFSEATYFEIDRAIGIQGADLTA